MIPVTQTRTGQEQGNCFESCIASILEIPLWGVPDFGDDRVFLDRIASFLLPRGLYYVQVKPDNEVLDRMFRAGPDIYHTIEGVSPRGGQHAVVGRNGKMVVDPHPQDGTARGLVSVECFGLICTRMFRPRLFLTGGY